jgi:hypothetical protein
VCILNGKVLRCVVSKIEEKCYSFGRAYDNLYWARVLKGYKKITQQGKCRSQGANLSISSSDPISKDVLSMAPFFSCIIQDGCSCSQQLVVMSAFVSIGGINENEWNGTHDPEVHKICGLVSVFVT